MKICFGEKQTKTPKGKESDTNEGRYERNQGRNRMLDEDGGGKVPRWASYASLVVVNHPQVCQAHEKVSLYSAPRAVGSLSLGVIM